MSEVGDLLAEIRATRSVAMDLIEHRHWVAERRHNRGRLGYADGI